MATGAAFNNITFKNFPVRAAFEIGASGFASVAVGRVDVKAGAIRDLMYHHRVPAPLEFAPGTSLLSEQSVANATNQLRMLKGATRSLEGISERACVLTFPFNVAANGTEVAKAWSKEFEMDCRVLQDGNTEEEDGDGGAPPGSCDVADYMAFLSHAAAAKSVAPERMLVVVEHSSRAPRGSAVEILGIARADGSDQGQPPAASEGKMVRRGQSSAPNRLGVGEALRLDNSMWMLQRAELPITVPTAHRILHTVVQRRNEEHYRPFRSPNPVQRSEFVRLRKALQAQIKKALPEWVMQKSLQGGVICGTSAENGMLLNIAARVAGQSTLSLDHLELNAEYHLCGLTDVLIGGNYPQPHLVLPQAALAAAMMRALQTPRLEYLPEVSPAVGALTLDGLWASGRRSSLEKQLESSPWMTDPKKRHFPKPFQAMDRRDPHRSANTTSKKGVVRNADEFVKY